MITVTTHTVEQPAMEFAGKPAKTLWYVKITSGKDTCLINIGKKTFDDINIVINEEQKTTKGKTT